MGIPLNHPSFLGYPGYTHICIYIYILFFCIPNFHEYFSMISRSFSTDLPISGSSAEARVLRKAELELHLSRSRRASVENWGFHREIH